MLALVPILESRRALVYPTNLSVVKTPTSPPAISNTSPTGCGIAAPARFGLTRPCPGTYNLKVKGRRILCRKVPGGNSSVVECDLAKVEVAGSNPVSRSKICSSQPSICGNQWHQVFY